jgi:DNA polymerase-3 subunit alpha
MAALLTQDMGNQDKTIKNIAECREMGIKILPPDLNESQADFAVVEEGIRFGLAAIKNVGLKAVESIIEIRDRSGPFKDMLDFCERMEGSRVNRRVLEGLIQCGAFDFTGMRRSTLFASLDDVIKLCGAHHDPNQLNMFSGLDEGGTGFRGIFEFSVTDEWDEREKLKREKEALGFYITGHPLDEFQREVDKFATCSIQDLLNLKDKSQVKIAGIIESLQLKRTKKGDRMAIFSLEDQTGSTQVILFPDIFNDYGRFLKNDEPLMVSGIVEVNENASKIIAKNIESLESTRQKSVKTIELPMDHAQITRDILEDLRDIFFKYPGECSVLFRIDMGNGENKLVSAHNHYKISPCDEILDEIRGVTGQGVLCRYE